MVPSLSAMKIAAVPGAAGANCPFLILTVKGSTGFVNLVCRFCPLQALFCMDSWSLRGDGCTAQRGLSLLARWDPTSLCTQAKSKKHIGNTDVVDSGE